MQARYAVAQEVIAMMFLALEDTKDLIRLEYHEMPRLSLTFWQAQRLWNLSEELCERALQSLIRERFLVATSTGTFIRTPRARS
jgi:hypothetical protein